MRRDLRRGARALSLALVLSALTWAGHLEGGIGLPGAVTVLAFFTLIYLVTAPPIGGRPRDVSAAGGSVLRESVPRQKEDAVDTDLMRQAVEGDMTPYALLFKRHADRIYRLAYLILHSSTTAEDVVQDTFTRGLDHIREYRGESGPRAWFTSIALKLCRHIIRDR